MLVGRVAPDDAPRQTRGALDHAKEFRMARPGSAALVCFVAALGAAASLPAGMSREGLPVGLQVVAPRHMDALLLSVSAAYEQARPWPLLG